ncbi:hypothetical protein [Thermus caldilimi]|uniref:hypothetical protein n=1 Tax=Thermus caldilimi TaxID=2483360 RepID=UPI001F0F7D4E|nr:hypothetical protein [Thermus caldilimi]
MAPVFRERPLMEAVWRRLREGKGGVYLVGSLEASRDPGSYFLVFSGLGGKLYQVHPWPLKIEGSFVVVDGRKGVIGPLVAGIADLEGRTREMTPDEARLWRDYGLALMQAGREVRYDLEVAMRLHVMRRLGILGGGR